MPSTPSCSKCARSLSPAFRCHGASARLDLLDDEKTRVTAEGERSRAARTRGKILAARIHLRPAGDRRAAVRLRGRALHGARRTDGFARHAGCCAELRSDTGVTTFSGKGLKIAGTTASFDGRLDDHGWQVQRLHRPAKVSALRKFAAPWFALPADITGDGKVRIEGDARPMPAQGLSADVSAALERVDLTNEASTIVTDKIVGGGATAGRTARRGHAARGRGLGHRGPGAGASHLLRLRRESARIRHARRARQDVLTIDSLHLKQAKLLDMTGSGRLNLAGETPSAERRVQAREGGIPGGVRRLRGQSSSPPA